MDSKTMRWTAVAALVALSAVACSSTDTASDDAGTGGSAGSAGAGGSAGSAGSAGAGGSAGDSDAAVDGPEVDGPEIDAALDGPLSACLMCVQSTCGAEFAACEAIASCASAFTDTVACVQSPPDGGTVEDCATDFVTNAATDMGGAAAANDLITCLVGVDGGTGCSAECGATP